MKCTCRDAPAAFAPLPDNRLEPARGFPGVRIWPAYFGLDAKTPDLDARPFEREQIVACPVCGQQWYVELGPEEGVSIDFALKLPAAVMPGASAVRAEKELLRVLAHAGFDEARCQAATCPNHALRGRALCHIHWHGEF